MAPVQSRCAQAVTVYRLMMNQIMCIVHLLQIRKKRNYKKNRRSIRDWLLRRNVRGFSHQFVRELYAEDESEFLRMFRMDTDIYNGLLAKLKPVITKMDTVMKPAVPPETKLEITLRYLADGTSYTTLSHMFRVSRSFISHNIPIVCDAISNALDEYTKDPSTTEEWKTIALDFQRLWNFPHCVGAVDGKHVSIMKPTNTGSEYYNFKHYFSIVLLAAVDAHARVIIYDLGRPGSLSDAGIFKDSVFSHVFQMSSIPKPERILDYPEVGYYFIGDEAFGLSAHMMKPFSRRNDVIEESVFNYRLCRARRISENCFGIMACRFRILLGVMKNTPENATKIVRSIIALHNFLVTCRINQYMPAGYMDQPTDDGGFEPGSWREKVREQLHGLERVRLGISTDGSNVRDILMEYFLNEGQVDFQWNKV